MVAGGEARMPAHVQSHLLFLDMHAGGYLGGTDLNFGLHLPGFSHRVVKQLHLLGWCACA